MGILDDTGDPNDDMLDEYTLGLSELYVPQTTPPPFPGIDTYIRERGFNPANIRNDITEEQLAEITAQGEKAWSRQQSGDQFFDSGLQSPAARVMNIIQGPEPSQVFDSKIQAVLDDQFERAKEAGVDFDGAPRSLQNQMWFVPETMDSPRAMNKLLGDYYTDAFDDDKYLVHDFKVQREPHTNRLMYENPETGQATFFFAPGMQGMDIAMELPKIGAMIGTNLALLRGTKGQGGIPLQLTSDILSYSGARYAELALARRRGLLKVDLGEGTRDWTNEEISAQVGKELLLVGGASASVPLAIRWMSPVMKSLTGSKMFDRVKDLPFEIAPFVQAFDQVKNYYAGLGPKALELFETMTAPQIMKAATQMDNVRVVPASPMGRMAAEAEGVPYTPEAFPDTMIRQMDEIRVAEAGDVPKLLEGQKRAQDEAFDRFTGDVLEEGGGQRTVSEIIDETGQASRTQLGEGMIDVAERVAAPAIAAETRVLTEITKEPLEQGRNFVKGATEGPEAAAPIRGTLEKAKQQRLDDYVLEMNNISSGLKFGRTIDTGPVIQNAKDLLAGVRKSFYPAMEREATEGLLDPIVFGVTKKGQPKKVTMDEVDGYIKSIREQKRKAMDAGDYPRYNAMKEVEGVWMDIQENAIREQAEALGGDAGEELIERLAANKQQYRQYIADFEEGIMEQLLGRVKGSTKSVGQYSLDDVAFINRLLANSSEADTIMLREILEKAENQDALNLVKGTIKQSYKDKMYTGPGQLKPLTKEQHDAWFQQNRRNIERWFDEDELIAFNNASDAAEAIEQRMLGQNEILAGLRKTPWGKELGQTVDKPSTLFNKTWGKDNFKQTKELYDILGKGGSAGDEVINGYKSQIMRDILDKSKNMTNTDMLEKYLNTNKDSLDVWYGPEFAKGLETHLRIMKVFDPSKGGTLKGPGLANRNVIYKAATDAARVYVGLFTRPGRILTAVSRLGFNAKQKRVVKDLLNPQGLVDRAKATQWMTDPYIQSTLRALQVFNITDRNPIPMEGGKNIPTAPELTAIDKKYDLGYYGPMKLRYDL
jgi:hypothetical protein